MPRPPLPLGTYGEIRLYQLKQKTWQARTKYRDYDGRVREVERRASTKARAKDRLVTALRDRSRAETAEHEVTASTRVNAVAPMWLRELRESDKALRTVRTYEESWERDLTAAVGELRLSEITPSLATRVLRSVQESTGAGSAKHAKVVLNGIMDIAVRFGAVDSNPVKQVTLPKQRKRSRNGTKSKTAITAEELPGLVVHLRSNKTWRNRDLPDLVQVLAGLGCRIGELLALDWSKIDFTAGTIAIEGTTIRITGSGLTVQEHTKSSAGMRTVTPPKWLMDILHRRYAKSEAPWVFPTKTGTLRDPDNMRGFLREAVRGTRWEGLHPHAFRHLVATELDRAGLSAREIADYLGHERVSMTQDVYMNRKTAGSSAAAALDGLARRLGEQK